jgi:Fis family transcriptional regulator
MSQLADNIATIVNRTNYENSQSDVTTISNTTVEGTYQENLKKFEASWLKKVMHSTKYNQSKAAIKMGWSRGTLRGKLKEHFGNEYFRDSDNG